MSTYVTLGTTDPARTNRFYDAVLNTIGWQMHADYPDWRAYSENGTGNGFALWIGKPFNGEAATFGNGTMVGLVAKSRDEVDAFYNAALASGGSDEGAPGPRLHYGPNWYAAYMRDPSGNKLAVYHNS